MFALKTYLSKFAALQPKLVEILNPTGTTPLDITHRWSTDSYHARFWTEGDTPMASPEKETRVITWSPEFTLRSPHGYSLEGRLDDDGGDSYWVLDLHIFSKNPLHTRKGFRGPYQQVSVHDILEQDLHLLPNLLAQKA